MHYHDRHYHDAVTLDRLAHQFGTTPSTVNQLTMHFYCCLLDWNQDFGIIAKPSVETRSSLARSSSTGACCSTHIFFSP